MAELSTPALRNIVKNFCPETVLYSEMLSAGSIVSGAPHNKPLVELQKTDDGIIYQIAGSDAAVMGNAAHILSDSACSGIDINMGCSAPLILKAGWGASLIKNPLTAAHIVRECRKKTDKKLTVKIRSGYESYDEPLFIQFIRMLESEGIDGITIHPRWAKLSFKRTADWKVITLAKTILSIPVTGNGDITVPEKAVQMADETRCDNIMIAREAVKSPWIFKSVQNLYNQVISDTKIDILDAAVRVLTDIKLLLPEQLHTSRGHRFCQYYSKNFRYGHELFSLIRKGGSIDYMTNCFREYIARNPDERYL
jgi:tRNA-dihydrouridine synthase B